MIDYNVVYILPHGTTLTMQMSYDPKSRTKEEFQSDIDHIEKRLNAMFLYREERNIDGN